LEGTISISEIIKADAFRVIGRELNLKNFFKAFRSKGFKYLLFLRLKKSRNIFVRLISKLTVRFLTYRYGFQIPSATDIGPGLFIGHFGIIVISINAKIGTNCNIAHNVTIGAARGKRAGAPEIGDRVWIGTGAVIVGKIKIENDVLIAPNSFVNRDIPSNTLVIGNPAKLISKINPTKDYINNQWVQ